MREDTRHAFIRAASSEPLWRHRPAADGGFAGFQFGFQMVFSQHRISGRIAISFSKGFNITGKSLAYQHAAGTGLVLAQVALQNPESAGELGAIHITAAQTTLTRGGIESTPAVQYTAIVEHHHLAFPKSQTDHITRVPETGHQGTV
jgi:hypothetical protein